MVLLRKLTALQHPFHDSINLKDEQQFRSLVFWLENNKIKRAQKDTLSQLENTESKNWENVYTKYKTNINCPLNVNREAELDYIAGCALRAEYGKNKIKFNKQAVNNLKTSTAPNVSKDNPLDNIDFSSREFIQGVKDLANVLKVSQHPNHLVTLEACKKVVEKYINVPRTNDGGNMGTPYPYHNSDLGFDLGDVGLNHAAKILRLLYIQDLRDLQTNANEVIVAVQNVTANPKTDTKLGRVGM